LKDFLRKKGSILIVIVLLVSLITGLTAHSLSGERGFISSTVNSLMHPIGSGVAVLADYFESIYSYMYKYDQLKTENEFLKAKITDIEQKLRDNSSAEEENKRLRELLKLKQKHTDFDLETTTIISWVSSNWTSTLTINKGKSSGLGLNDCVITENGFLVGQIIELDEYTAKARSIIDPSMNIGALLDRTGIPAIASGDFEAMRKGNLKLTYIPEGAATANGDIITTSGKGQTIPKGLVIGKVVDASIDISGIMRYAIIKPSAALNELSQVFVIKSFNVED
jgi:rod shape-determining protein MreC